MSSYLAANCEADTVTAKAGADTLRRSRTVAGVPAVDPPPPPVGVVLPDGQELRGCPYERRQFPRGLSAQGALSVARPTVTAYKGGAQMVRGEPAGQARAGHPMGARPQEQRRMCTVIRTALTALPASPAAATAIAASSLPARARTRTVARVARVVKTVAHT